MSKRIWWILGGVAVLAAGVYFAVPRYVIPYYQKVEDEKHLRLQFNAFGESPSTIQYVTRRGLQISGHSKETNVYLDVHTRQVTGLVRWPQWYSDYPVPTEGKPVLASLEDAQRKLQRTLTGVGLGAMKYEILKEIDVSGNEAKNFSADGRRTFVLWFLETFDDTRYFEDGRRYGLIRLCAQTGKVLRFSMGRPVPKGQWVQKVDQAFAEGKAKEAWAKFIDKGDVTVSRVTVEPMWILKDRNPRNRAALSGAHIVRGFDAKGDIRCYATVDTESGTLLSSACGLMDPRMNWTGSVRPRHGQEEPIKGYRIHR
jgi:hypothetical protein